MKAAQFDYARPASLETALAMLDGGAKPMSGGQSLGPMLNLRLARPSRVVDLGALPSMAAVLETADGIRIGAGVTHAAIEDGRHAPLRGHPVQGVAAQIAYRAVRNRGTVGGSLAHADPAADWVVVLTALGATLTLASATGSRDVPMHAFMQGAYTTVLADDELVAAVTVPKLDRTVCWGYDKFCRKPGEFAEASAAVLFAPGVRTARIVLGALDGPPRELAALAASIARDGAPAAARDRILAAVREALPQHDAVDCRLRTVCVERALARAGIGASAA
ncbi:MAG: xanthine dehydrogenase family protein subunit M [Lautropia sp.]